MASVMTVVVLALQRRSRTPCSQRCFCFGSELRLVLAAPFLLVALPASRVLAETRALPLAVLVLALLSLPSAALVALVLACPRWRYPSSLWRALGGAPVAASPAPF
ncbi:hypothetical protein GN958_ATG05074 [Phytophthora infestans]|uniref:Transmembrane protein n=1 Tax=Phytophthora infestans TaxID=4787 RepID=A0A8S9V129_PHYIN|nr:hypothetical protein GN958_ATG05074 [Phytophthora infestans]